MADGRRPARGGHTSDGSRSRPLAAGATSIKSHRSRSRRGPGLCHSPARHPARCGRGYRPAGSRHPVADGRGMDQRPVRSWPTTRLRHTGPWNATNRNPILVIGTRFDRRRRFASPGRRGYGQRGHGTQRLRHLPPDPSTEWYRPPRYLSAPRPGKWAADPRPPTVDPDFGNRSPPVSLRRCTRLRTPRRPGAELRLCRTAMPAPGTTASCDRRSPWRRAGCAPWDLRSSSQN